MRRNSAMKNKMDIKTLVMHLCKFISILKCSQFYIPDFTDYTSRFVYAQRLHRKVINNRYTL